MTTVENDKLLKLVMNDSELGTRLLSLLLLNNNNNKTDLLNKINNNTTTHTTEDEHRLKKRQKNTEASARFRARQKIKYKENLIKLNELNTKINKFNNKISLLELENKNLKLKIQKFNELKTNELLNNIKKIVYKTFPYHVNKFRNLNIILSILLLLLFSLSPVDSVFIKSSIFIVSISLYSILCIVLIKFSASLSLPFVSVSKLVSSSISLTVVYS
ncbi:hypothetical protein KAFR_0K00870 [Kazachstania africana CBS 2517]|uniref:BZIP domain-containing protein n=1 Tax=Kazachstania africana (strain ATCC 22294 / BCRC 22015 / CBS 2517 / CECT 1963 / NBRC 1671 / NRRL Y-8276) TaxID=1071382 RepID=H2B1E3_KAZAF|nr:hypothetical protein KAFR_0K00870 [Kazachstania africana CBS 2517]CCF60443.1 hypothetical protein KAFR_0K00870 [Kazachstania africana CBS 2517]